jgi:transposase-like protein
MSGDHELPEHFVLKWMRDYEDKVERLEELNADEVVAERKRNASVFSDVQTERIEGYIAKALVALLGSDAFSRAVAKEVTFIASSQALRLWVWVAGSFTAGAISVAVGYWLKAH